MRQGQVTLSDGLNVVTRTWECDEPRVRILIVHGLGEHSGRWHHVADFFTERGYEVHGYDLRGHGLSGGAKLDVPDFHRHVADLAEIVATLRVDRMPLVIYGHSMGGLITLGYAVSDHPQPAAYVLSAPALGATVPAPLRAALKVLSKVVPQFRLPASIEGEHLSKNPAVGEAYFADPNVHLKGTAASGQSFLDAMESIGSEIHEIEVPTLVVHGGEDVLVPTAASAPLAAVAGVVRKVFPTLRHEIHNEDEHPEVLEYIETWIAGQIDSIS